MKYLLAILAALLVVAALSWALKPVSELEDRLSCTDYMGQESFCDEG